ASDLYEIEKQLKSGENPRNIKVRLAKEIVKIYHGEQAAQKAEEEFINIFSNKQKPTNIPKFAFREDMNILGIMVASEMVSSNSEGRRMIEQNAVKVNEIIVNDIEQHGFKSGDIIQVGKRRYIELV
ncbi:MAG: tyrosine--tRNA ligase, partial [Candidatus Komeilibacteria bacterium]